MKNKGCLVLGGIAVVIILLLIIRFQIKEEEKIQRNISIRENSPEWIEHDRIEDSISKSNREEFERENSRTCEVCGKHYFATGYSKALRASNGKYGNFCNQDCVNTFNDNSSKSQSVNDYESTQSTSAKNSNYNVNDDDYNPNRNSCTLCKGKGVEYGGIVNGQREAMICRLCKGTGKGHY